MQDYVIRKPIIPQRRARQGILNRESKNKNKIKQAIISDINYFKKKAG